MHTLKILLSIVCFHLYLSATTSLKIITFEEAKGLYEQNNTLFVDARPAKLYKNGTIPNAMNIEPKLYSNLKKFLPYDKSANIVTFCNGLKCEHSDNLANLLMNDGYQNVLVYKGGFPEWQEKKMPQMGILRECKEITKTSYVPKTTPKQIKGATVYLLKDDPTMIDQFWFAPIVLNKLPENIQLVDIRKPKDFEDGHLPGAINIPYINGKLDITKMPQNKLNVIYCNTGMQSTEAVSSIKNNDGSIIYFDATIKCKGTDCTVTPNEPL